MASTFNIKVMSALNKGHTSSYYSSDKANPVFTALDQETAQFMAYMKKRSAPGYKLPEGETYSRPSDTLFELWNKYEPRLPKIYYQEKLLEMGDLLILIEEFKLALWQCYERYLQHFGEVNIEEVTDVDVFRQNFFPGGFDAENAGLTFRALMGKSITMYQVVRLSDPKLQNKQSVERCVHILSFLRLIMQVVLPRESLCWLVFNGTVHIYSVSRHLMSMGHSARVLEYLLWASVCMETSVPLMGVHYLTWRATLYTAVCQCYYDCKAGQHAEGFARRGLAKINELSQLEHLSSSVQTQESEFAFRQATVRMAVMVYKRSVFETRRKPKGLLRPKTRANLKEAMNIPWPRTPTEKMLADMFEGGSAQFMAILESLTDSNRRILLTIPPTADNEPEIVDVFAELFLAAQELLAGGGGTRTPATKTQMQLGAPPLSGLVKGMSLIDLATRGEDGIPLDCAIRFLKLTFNFEYWDLFKTLVDPVLAQIKEGQGERLAWDEKAIELLQAMERIISSRRHSKKPVIPAAAVEGDQLQQESEGVAEPAPNPTTTQSPDNVRSTVASVRSLIGQDDLITLADVLMSIVNGPFKRENIEVDMVVDATLYLWGKCKSVFQKFQTGSIDNPRYLQKMDNSHKWMYLLDCVHQVLGWTGISSVDPTLTAEVVLRLAMVLESSAQLETMDDAKTAFKESKATVTDLGAGGGVENVTSRASFMSLSSRQMARQQLAQAREILRLGLENVNYARTAVALNDGNSIADVSWIKELHPDLFGIDATQNIAGEKDPPEGSVTSGKSTPCQVNYSDAVYPEDLTLPIKRGSATAVWNTVKDLHLELILVYHRVTLKLANLAPSPAELQKKGNTSEKPTSVRGEKSSTDINIKSFEELKEDCGRNLLSKSLLYMQRAIMLGTDSPPSEEQQTLLDEAMDFIQRAQVEERRTYFANTKFGQWAPVEGTIPPPPILLCRTDRTMIFKPAPFIPVSGQKVAWYRLFGRNAAGSNVKVRMGDFSLQGTGDEVPSCGFELKVSGLQPNERYVFAVAAYTADGTMIGGSIGETSKPVLASHPLPVLTTWAFLSQISYQVGHYSSAKRACEVLWDHFVALPPPPKGTTVISEAKRDFRLTLLKLNQRAICLSSPVLLHQFLTSMFINVDIAVRQNGLYCDVLTDQGPLYTGQIHRLGQCEKMIVAMQLAGWLNESSHALQALVQCYGLVAPMLYHKIPALPVIQVLQHCHAALQEIPQSLIQKRQGHITDSLHHMTACITYHLTKVLRMWGQKKLANKINEAGRKLLTVDSNADNDKDADGEASMIEFTETGSMTLAALKKKKRRSSVSSVPLAFTGGGKSRSAKEDEVGVMVNEELRALEAYMMKANRAAQGEHELTGNEDLNILHAYIAYLPSYIAFKEVNKFRRRARYLEFMVQVAQKGMTEGELDEVLNWCEETNNWLIKRNETIGPKAYMSKQVGAITVAGNDPKKYAAAVAEYSKKDQTSPRAGKEARAEGMDKTAKPTKNAVGGKGKKTKYKALRVTASMTEAQKLAQEQVELKALECLGTYFVDLFHNSNRKQRLRKTTIEEMPWRCQLNLIEGLCRFGSFLKKLERREKLFGSSYSSVYRTSILDREWFTFETAGTLVVGWEGGPAGQKTAHAVSQMQGGEMMDNRDRLNRQALDLANEDRPKTTGIEFAAAAATGAVPPPLYPIPPEIEDTPRTYRSGAGKADHAKADADLSLLSTSDTVESITRSLHHFRAAVVFAHRGQHWTLLQNGARALWNCLHTAMLRTLTTAQEGEEEGLVTAALLNKLAWQPLYITTDCLLDMLFRQETDYKLQATKGKSKGKPLGPYFESWFGSIKAEKGGAGLKFDVPLDDLSTVDARWVRRLVLRCLEMLYYQNKWEKLVDIALRFIALSNGRYAEQVIPLLVQAQRKVAARIEEAGGPAVPQPHFRELTEQLGRLVTARDFLTLQLKLHFDPSRANLIQPGAQIDPLGHNAYAVADAYRLSSVPLDVNLSLETLRAVLQQSHYTARALQHSRMLLILYLAGQQNSGMDSMTSRQPTKVDFLSDTAHPQPTCPPDRSKEEFLSVDVIQASPIPRSQLACVVSSYEKTIEMLMAKNQKGLASQTMQELGNIHYHAANIRAAYGYWAEALDTVLGMVDSLHCWRRESQGSDDISRFLLNRCGQWGCIMAAVLAASIAQYILTADLGLRMECCFLSGHLFKALFRASLPHPTSDHDYALYDVGEGCEVTNLVPGFDFLSDRFRANGRSVVSALRWVTEELARGRHNLFVLPLLTLYQYFTTFVCRDLQRCVDGRILRVRVLTDLGLFSEAQVTLMRLLHGERLPHIGDSSFRQTESKMSSTRFNTSNPLIHPNNLKVLENILDKRLSSYLATLFGPHLTCHLSLAQCHLLVAIADTIPVLPDMEEAVVSGPGGDKTINTHSRGKGTKGGKGNLSKYQGSNAMEQSQNVQSEEDLNAQRFTDEKNPPSLELIKGTLLLVADCMVTTMSDVMCENAANDKAGTARLAAAELELVVLCRLEQAAVALQKQHAPMAARTVLSALKLLHDSHLFQPKKPAPPPPRTGAALNERPSSLKGTSRKQKADQRSSAERGSSVLNVRLVEEGSNQFQFQNFQSRARLDPRLWLTCRLALVKALNAEIRGMGEVKGPENKVLTELGECRQYCVEGLKEAEACGGVELQAEFLLQAVLLNISEGRSLERTIAIIDDAVRLLRSVSCLSLPAEELLATCYILRTDLEAGTKSEVPSNDTTQRTLQAYLQAQDIILKQMEALGEKIEHHLPLGQLRHLSVPLQPMQNIYTTQILYLARLKLRIGHAMARNLAKAVRSGRVVEGSLDQWVECLNVLTKALGIMQLCMRREAAIEAEILLTMGRVQRMLVFYGRYQPRAAAATLLEAIKVSYTSDHDLGLIRQAYLEIALVYLQSSGSIVLKDGLYLELKGIAKREDELSSASMSSKEKKSVSSKKQPSKLTEVEVEQEKERKAAWVAIRCAAAAAQAMRARGMLIGEASITAMKVSENELVAVMPDFAALDMMNPYVLGEKKKVWKNEIEEELAPLIEAQEVKVQETYEDKVKNARTASCELSRIQLLGYQTIIQRLCVISTIAACSSPAKNISEEETHSDFDLGFVSKAQLGLGHSYDVVRYMFLSNMWSIRLNNLHHYLCTVLPQYASDCCAVYPPQSITDLTTSQAPTDLSVNIKLEQDNLDYVMPPPGCWEDPHKPSDKAVAAPTDNEAVFQWYQSPLEEADPAHPDLNPADRRLILLSALSSKTTGKQIATNSGFSWVSLHKINDLHDRLFVLEQRGEISLADKTKKELPSTPTTAKSKKVQRIKALSPKLQRDEQLENLLRQCLEDITSLMGGLPEQGDALSPEQIPIEVSKQNLKNLEQLFDPSLGHHLCGTDLVQWILKLLA